MSTDIDTGVIQVTQKLLGKFIKKPPLTEKLLRKPPFRFLHDIITSVIRETGFLKGLYSERELVSENVKEKEDKIAFLTKLVDAVKSITGVKLAVRAAKVIAGLEPQETNLLLQTIGGALDRKLDSSAYIAELKQNKKVRSEIKVNDQKLKQDKIKTKSKTSINPDPGKTNQSPNNIKNEHGKKLSTVHKPKPKEKSSSSRDSKESVRREALRTKPKLKRVEKLVTPQSVAVEHKTVENQDNNIPHEKESNGIITISEEKSNIEEIVVNDINTNNEDYQHNQILENEIIKVPENGAIENIEDIDNTIKNPETQIIRSSRPRTATLRKNEPAKLIAPELPQIEKVTERPFVRPRSSLRPPSVRPSSARPGAPRLRLDATVPEGEVVQLGKVNVMVENYDNKELEEEETVTIETAPEIEYQQPTFELPTDKGHLVDQILKQINKDEFMEHNKPLINIEWEQDGLRSRNAANKEIEHLRTAIQTLTRTANPLGKLVNYLHEDIEAMHTELDMWINTTRQITSEIAANKRFSIESNKPLQKQLEEIEDNIVKHRQQIVSINGNIIRNEQRVRELLLSKI